MAHDVFICYSMKDRAVADAACAALEHRGIRCWVAPRDTQGAVFHAQTVVDAISVSRFMVLILSSNSNDSPHVIREVERAASGGPVVIPFRIENVSLSKSLQFFLGPVHWLDAFTPPLEKHLSRLADNIELLIKRAGAGSAQPAPGLHSGAEPRQQPVASPFPLVAPRPQAAPRPRPRAVPEQPLTAGPQSSAKSPPAPSPAPRAATQLARSAVGVPDPTARAVWFASVGAAAGGLVALAALLVYPTVDTAGALGAFWVSGGIIAGAVTWCCLHGSRRHPPATALFGALGGLIAGGLVEWVSTYAFAISSRDAGRWIVTSAVLWGAYGWVVASSLERGEGARLGFDGVGMLVGVSMVRFLSIGLLTSEWIWVLWLHDALLAIGWRLGLAASRSLQPATGQST